MENPKKYMSEEKFQELLIGKREDRIEKPYKLEDLQGIIRENTYVEEKGRVRTDYRTGEKISYCPGRDKRAGSKNNGGKPDCPICIGNTTPIIYSRDISNGKHAFVNENLYPIVALDEGLHFLIWPSTEHVDIDEMDPRDYTASFKLLGDLESIFLNNHDKMHDWHMQVIKNTGKYFSSSLPHGHLQALLTKSKPRIEKDYDNFDKRIHQRYKESFASYYRGTNSAGLIIKDYGNVVASIPNFARRPLQAIVMVKNMDEFCFSRLTQKTQEDFARATGDIARVLKKEIPNRFNREFAYKMVFHNLSPGGLYVQINPNTQGEGGFEDAGYSGCQMSPEESAEIYREHLKTPKLKSRPARFLGIPNKYKNPDKANPASAKGDI